MTKDKMDNFLDRLSPDVMKRILWDFWDWMNEEGCPLERDSQYPCEWRESDEYSSSKEPALNTAVARNPHSTAHMVRRAAAG